MRWIAAIGLAGAALAGCDQTTNEDALGNYADISQQEEMAPPADQSQNEAEAPGDQTDDTASGDGDDASDDSSNGSEGRAANALPPVGSGLRFVGMWASNAANCENLAWRFTASRLQTPAGSVCTFDDVNAVAGGYDISATCTAEGPPTEDTIEIRFAESAKAMMFDSETIADAGLVYCGRG